MPDTAQPSSPPAQAKQPRMLTLPAELRNRIYRLAILEDHDVTVDQDFKLPAMLHVCRKTREEAKSIYFLEQTFRIDVTGFESANYAGFLHTLGGHEYYEKIAKAGTLTLTTIGSEVKFCDVMRWCKAVYEGKLPGCKVIHGGGQGEAAKVSSRCFKIVNLFKAKLDWDDMEELLWQYKLGCVDAANLWWGFQDDEIVH